MRHREERHVRPYNESLNDFRRSSISHDFIPGKHRGGIIPYYLDDNREIIIGMGIDTSTGELTDFGGGLKKTESVIEGAFREFKEESGEVFPLLYDISHISGVCIHDRRLGMSLIFVPIMKEDIFTTNFRVSDEIIEVVWIKFNRFMYRSIKPFNVWHNIKLFFDRNVRDRYLSLYKMLVSADECKSNECIEEFELYITK